MPNPDTPADAIEIIGRGRTADVWRRPDGTVVKLFRPDRPVEWIDAEAEVSRVVASLDHTGYVVPSYHGRVEVGARSGVVLGEVAGREMLGLLGARPWALGRLARRLAEVQLAVHRAGPAAEVDRLPSLIDRMVRQVQSVDHVLGALAPLAIADLRRSAEDRPDVLCHGDYHPGNVLLGSDGTASVIDWTNAAFGPAAMDVAMTTILLTCAEVPGRGPVRQMMVLGRRAFHGLYRRHLRRSASDVVAEADGWIPAMAAARVADSPAGEHAALLRLAGRLAER
jgi:aminoglycoside phosphotransferase (APT) family kinase protein